MSFIKSLFGKDEEIESYEDFWNWFRKHEKTFFKVVKTRGNIDQDFFDKVSPKLNQLGGDLFLLTGMCEENTAELIITPDGNLKKIYLAEEIVAAAPNIDGWRFTALKQEEKIDFGLSMGGYEFTDDNLYFVPNETWDYPDEIDITILHDSLSDESRPAITNGIYIFLDNCLGELAFATTIDNLDIENGVDLKEKRRPISELKPYLATRVKAFAEKYEGSRYDTENDAYASFEAETKDNCPIVGIINTSLLNWDRKASHPWVMVVRIAFDGRSNNGLADNETYEFLDKIEDDITHELKDFDGYLNVGRQTGDNKRHIYFACKDVRKPSKVLDGVGKRYAEKVEIEFDIYKDKYWRTFDRFSSTDKDVPVN